MRSCLQAHREPDGRAKQHPQKVGNNRRVPVVPLDSTLQDLPHLHLRGHLIQGERTDGLTTWSPRTCKPFKLCLLPAHCTLPHLPRAEPTSTLPFPSPTQPSNEARCCGEAAVGPPPCPRASCAPAQQQAAPTSARHGHLSTCHLSSRMSASGVHRLPILFFTPNSNTVLSKW